MTTEISMSRPAFVASDTYGPVLLPATIAAGADLVKGTILGRVTASGKLVAYTAGNSDGSQTPVAVLGENAAAATADVDAIVCLAGVYAEVSMTGLDSAGKLALEARGIFFK